jgi:pimeloyl-ACP methyl ester carboxylesterase
VGSSPRTGTTLLAELLHHGFAIDAALEHECAVFAEPPEPCAVWLSKRPRDVLVAGAVLAADPALWILHMVRDPRDVVVSRHRKAPDRYWTHLGLWHLYRRAARRLAGHPRFLTLRYEDLVADPDRVQEEIAAFLPFLSRRRAFSLVHRTWQPSEDSRAALGGARAVSADSVGIWRQHLPRLRAQIERHGSIDRDLRELGYETDDAWKRLLASVAPKNGATFLPEPIGLRRRYSLWRRRRRDLRRFRRRLRRRRREEPLAPAGPFQIEGLRLSRALLEIGSLGSGAPVVCLPGQGGAGTEQFGALAEALAAAGYRCIAVNPRGVGSSRGPLAGIGLRDLADDVAELIVREGGAAHVVGRAFGNRVARALAAAHPERVTSLTLLAAGGLVPGRPGPPRAAAAPAQGARWRQAARAQRRAAEATPLSEWWDGGTAPMLVVQGLDDRIAPPENGRSLARRHPDRVRLLELEGAGHDPLRERPDRVIPAVLAFLRAQGAATPGALRATPRAGARDPRPAPAAR